jgi:hypothetical protein
VFVTERISTVFKGKDTMKKSLIAFAAVAFLAMTPALSLAGFIPLGTAISLDQLVSGQTLQAGDKLFSNFTYTSSGDFPVSSDVNVTPGYDSATGNYGIEIQGGFLAFSGNASATLGYTVSVTTPGLLISDIHMAGNPDLVGGPGSLGSIVVDQSLAQDPTTLQISDIDGTKIGQDGANLTGLYSSVDVTTTITGTLSDINPGIPTISFIDQTFSQSAVPEPATIVLLVTGALAAIPAYRLRRRKD